MKVQRIHFHGVLALAAGAALVLAGPVSAAQPRKGPLKVFVLAGQSNMDGQANVSTIDFLGEDPDKDRAALLKKFKPDGKTLVTRDDVWVASGGVYGNLAPGYGGRKNYDRLGNNIGPEYAFGYFLGEAMPEQVLLIKYAPGGQSLYVNFRPPSAGMPQSTGVKPEDVGSQYRALTAYVHDTLDNLKKRFPDYDEEAGYEITGLVWFQGYNDMFDETGRKEYGRNLACLIHDLRKEFKAPNMKVVVGVMGVNGVMNEVGKQKDVRDGQRFISTVPEFQGNVKAIETAPLLHPEVVALKTAGWLNTDRDLKKSPITPDEQAMLARATSNLGFHYYGEGRFFILLGKSFADAMLELMLPANGHAWQPNAKDLDAAIDGGDFSAYLANTTAWLNRKSTCSESNTFTEAAWETLLKEPVFANTLDQRQLLFKTGADQLGALAKADPANRVFLAWLMKNTPAMDLYLEGATPLSIAAREKDGYTLSTDALEIWKKIFHADPDSRQGLYLRLAIATAIAPPGSGSPGAGQAKPPADPVARYQHFKAAHKNKELFPGFDDLSVWEFQKVVQSGASNSDLAWAREMINTWRPDLRIHEQVVNSTSEVWRRNSPHPYTDYKSVLSGGGKCGPRSSWSVMICQAFGMPAIGVGQPAHACVAYKVSDPSVQPQPGSDWKVGYGRGWQVSKLEGMSGPDFLASVAERSRAVEFSQVEHLRWLASSLASKEQADAVMEIAHKIQKSLPAAKTDLSASAKAAEADKELPSEAQAGKAPAVEATPVKVMSGKTRIEAAAFSDASGVCVYDCYTGGKQVNFQKNMDNNWVEYTLEAAVAGTYGLEIQAATPNFDQVLEIGSETGKLATVQVPNTTGLWDTTKAVEIQLKQGKQTLRLSAPYQRGVAVRYMELEGKDR